MMLCSYKTEEMQHHEHAMLKAFWAWLKSLPVLTDPTDVDAWQWIGQTASQTWLDNGQDPMLLAWMDAHMQYIEKEARDVRDQSKACEAGKG